MRGPQPVRRILSSVIGLVALAPPPAGNQIVHVHATQAVQAQDVNVIPLVRGRPTAFRVRAADDLAGQQLSATLKIRQGATLLYDLTGTRAPWTPAFDWNELGATLNFAPPSPPILLPAGTVTVAVELFSGHGTTPIGQWSENFTTVEPLDLRVRWVPVRVKGVTDTLGLPTHVKPGVADAFLRGVFPVRDNAPALSLWAAEGEPHLFEGAGVNHKIDDDSDESLQLLNELADYVDASFDVSVPFNARVRVYGWIAEAQSGQVLGGGHLGWSDDTLVGYGTTFLLPFQACYAHEIGHTLGEVHLDDDVGPLIGFDPADRLWEKPEDNGVDEYGRWLKTENYDNFMESGPQALGSWVSGDCYLRLLKIAAQPVVTKPLSRTPTSMLAIHGRWIEGGPDIPRVEPVWKYPWPIPPGGWPGPSPGPDPPYHAAVTYRTAALEKRDYVDLSARPVDGRIEVTEHIRFSGAVHSSQEGERESIVDRMRVFHLRVAVPNDAEFRSVRILRESNGELIAERVRPASSIAPIVSGALVEPDSDAKNRKRLRWRVTDPDTPPRELYANVSYSPDRGRTFHALRVALTARDDEGSFAISFDPRNLRASKGDGVLRIFVTDGFDTAMHDVERLTFP